MTRWNTIMRTCTTITTGTNMTAQPAGEPHAHAHRHPPLVHDHPISQSFIIGTDIAQPCVQTPMDRRSALGKGGSGTIL